jgi:hypothetical protein
MTWTKQVLYHFAGFFLHWFGDFDLTQHNLLETTPLSSSSLRGVGMSFQILAGSIIYDTPIKIP